ncbi:MAG TPA: transferrin receptor-like dimerization domain-containing protein [Candidatus Acidoferrales bacterium]|nr:transferrin receptor-like dimerization domain-containing protein [Candidatus Acidoferrales bacterium]
MRRVAFLLVIICCLPLLTVGQQEEQAKLAGFFGNSSADEQTWEQKFRAIPSPDNMIADMKLLAARPHNVGSPYDKQNSEWILAQYKKWGWDAHIETFQVLFPTPKLRVLEMVSPAHFVAKLQEPPVPGDPTSSQQTEQLPSYNAYSPDGDVTAPLVYVNYGVPEDYDQLARMGISVKGAIVITRYGHSWRGIKPKLAAEHGAIGCLIYSDPRDDGYYEGDVFPKGPWRPSQGVQRGSVMKMELYPGDPLTPGVGADEHAKRLPIKEAKTLEDIPVLPISYGDAEPLLKALSGPVAPPDWRGALPITYHVGPGPARVHLKLQFNWDLKPVHDVIAKLAGSNDADEWIVRGNHYDGWVNGAEDPIAGQVALLEEARSLGEIYKQGWRPKRTIIYCSWDGEEPGLLGSTEWVEEHGDELATHAVAYINSDTNGRGYLEVEGSHSLESLVNHVANDIEDPEKGISVGQRHRFAELARAQNPDERKKLESQKNFIIGDLGSGSDYSSFIDHAGIASINYGFGGEVGGGIYHSIYDDFYWYSHFDDPTEQYGRTLAQTVGTTVMRLADSDVPPLDFTGLSDAVGRFLDELKKLDKTEIAQIEWQNKEVQDGIFTATTDPTKKFVPPATEEVPQPLDFSPLDDALKNLKQSAEHYQSAFDKAQQGSSVSGASLQAVDQDLIATERDLLSEAGLPGRPWYKHQLYAPGIYTGYGVKTVPGVREAIEQKNWSQATEEIGIVAGVLQKEADSINAAAAALSGAAAAQ